MKKYLKRFLEGLIFILAVCGIGITIAGLYLLILTYASIVLLITIAVIVMAYGIGFIIEKDGKSFWK